MLTYTDQLNRKIILPVQPKRIISLVPSQTELLFDLGLDEEVIGITKFCVHPTEWFRRKTRVGGTKNVHIHLVRSLQPDLIIANKEENTKEQVDILATIAPVWISDIANTTDALRMIESIGQITAKAEKATALINQIKSELAALSITVKQQLPENHRTAYLIWKDPYMTAGADTFIHDILQLSGLRNIFGNRTRYPEVTITDLRKKNIQLLLLATEPYPFRQKHIDELTKELPGTRILLADGEIFSWYGSRMLHIRPYIQGLFEQILASKS